MPALDDENVTRVRSEAFMMHKRLLGGTLAVLLALGACGGCGTIRWGTVASRVQ